MSLEQVMAEAKWELKNKHPVKAVKLLLPLKDEGWDDGDYLSMLGIAYCMAGHFTEGLEALYRELDIAPSASVHYNLGQAHQMAGDYDKAKECYHHCQSLDPTDQHAVLALQRIAEAEKKTAEPDGTGLGPEQITHEPLFAASGSGTVFHAGPPAADGSPAAESVPAPAPEADHDSSAQDAPAGPSAAEIAQAAVWRQASLYGAAIGAFACVMFYVFLQVTFEMPFSILAGGPRGSAMFAAGALVAGAQGAAVGLISARISRYLPGRSGGAMLATGLMMLALALVISYVRKWGAEALVTAVVVSFFIGSATGWFIQSAVNPGSARA